MARRTLIWHLGLAQSSRPVVGTSLAAHREALEAGGLRLVASETEARLATYEILRTHRDAALSRADVEGQWARICDRVWAHKGVSVLSTPDLCVADKVQLRLALDPLIGVEVHLVVTAEPLGAQLYGAWLAELRAGRSTGWEKYAARVLDHLDGVAEQHPQGERFRAGHDLPAVLARWGWTVRADRVHVVVAADPVAQWAGFLDVLSLGVVSDEVQGLPDLPALVPAYADPAGVAVLRRVNRQVDAEVAPESRGLLLGSHSPADDETDDARGMPAVDTLPLRPLLEKWAVDLAATGIDVRGDLPALASGPVGAGLPGRGDQLAVAVDALGDALGENTRLRAEVASLRADNERLDRKRRKLKRRMSSLSAVAEEN